MNHRFALGTQVERVFAEIAGAVEVGLYVYQVDDPSDPGSLRLVYANPASVAATGVDFAEIIGQPIRRAFPGLMETDLPAVYQAIAQGGAARELGDIAYGDDRVAAQVFSVRAFPLPQGTVGVSFTNLTAQRLAEQQAVQTLESMREAFVTVDDDWCFTYLNPQCEPILGQPREHLVGKSVWGSFPEWVGTRFEDECRRAARDQVPVAFEDTHEPFGMVLETRVYPISAGLAVYFRDVTQERQVAAQLRQSQRLEAIGRVTAGVAHDFNNLLTVIRGFAGLGQSNPHDPDKALKYFDEIDSAGQKATELTRQLLAFGRQQELTPTSNDLNDVVRGLASLLGHLLTPNITLEYDLSDEPVTVYIDRAQLEQVILNLVVNSRDAIAKDGTITVRTSRVPPSAILEHQVGCEVGWLQVSDNGSGIPDDVRTRMFEPFFSTKPPSTGTGLGLATIYGILAQSGGDIYVDSTLDVGTTMTVVLPDAATQPLTVAVPA